MTVDTIIHRLQRNGTQRPNDPAYYVKRNGTWHPTSWGTYLSEVRQAARALIALGLEPGGAVTILGFNRPEWVILDLAAMMVGGVAAGIYTTNSPHEVQYIVDNAAAKLILLEDVSQLDKIRQVREELDCLEHVVMMKDNDEHDDALSWEAFMAKGNEVEESVVDERISNLKEEDLATLIYTSGTTGPPKGVMLSHLNLAWTATQSVSMFDLGPTDSTLSYLPLSHIAEQMFTIHSPITVGYQVYFAESGLKVADNLKEVQPTIVFGVPRVWERFYSGLTARLGEAEGLKAKIAEWAQRIGREHMGVRHQGKTPGGMLDLQYKIADRLFYSKVKEAIGFSNIRHGMTGAAPVAKEILEFFSGIDIPIYEVYGQSEDCGPTSVNRPGATKYGTVGQAFPGTEVKLADDGEILVRGNNVFMGYYKDPNATAQDLQDGWLHSGDLGQFDEDGYLSIIGRKKEIIITSGGKNIAPKNIEAALKNIPLVADAVVIGEQRRYITALVSLEPEAAAKFAEEHGLPLEDLHENPKMIEAMQQGIDEYVNPFFARVEQVRGFKILHRNLSVEEGELTPTLKVKRRIVNENFANEIESLYAD